jgi:hypothetical protein
MQMTTTETLSNLYTPGGRFVTGDLVRKGDKDYDGRPIPPEEQEYFFGVAVPKTDPGVNDLLGQLFQLASAHYGSNAAISAQIQQGLTAPGFSWKVQDGDAPVPDNRTGQMKETPEYYKGCYIFKFKTKYEFGACDEQNIEMGRDQIKRGDYVDVMFSATPNGRVDGNAGIILYPNAIRRLGYGEAIISGVAASDAFANRAAVAPPGATSMPQASGQMPSAPQAAPAGMPTANPMNAPTATMPTPQSGQPAPAGMPTVGAAPQASPTASPSDAGVAPHNGILAGPPSGGMPGV